MRSRRIGVSTAAGAGLLTSVLVGLAAGRLTAGDIDPAISPTEATRPWRHVEPRTPTDTSASETSVVVASLGSTYFAGPNASTAPHELVTTSHDPSDRELDAEMRRLDSKLDAEIRQGDRDAKRAAEQFQDAPADQLNAGANQELRSALLPAGPQDAPPKGDLQPSGADQASGPTT